MIITIEPKKLSRTGSRSFSTTSPKSKWCKAPSFDSQHQARRRGTRDHHACSSDLSDFLTVTWFLKASQEYPLSRKCTSHVPPPPPILRITDPEPPIHPSFPDRMCEYDKWFCVQCIRPPKKRFVSVSVYDFCGEGETSLLVNLRAAICLLVVISRLYHGLRAIRINVLTSTRVCWCHGVEQNVLDHLNSKVGLENIAQTRQLRRYCTGSENNGCPPIT